MSECPRDGCCSTTSHQNLPVRKAIVIMWQPSPCRRYTYTLPLVGDDKWPQYHRCRCCCCCRQASSSVDCQAEEELPKYEALWRYTPEESLSDWKVEIVVEEADEPSLSDQEACCGERSNKLVVVCYNVHKCHLAVGYRKCGDFSSLLQHSFVESSTGTSRTLASLILVAVIELNREHVDVNLFDKLTDENLLPIVHIDAVVELLVTRPAICISG